MASLIIQFFRFWRPQPIDPDFQFRQISYYSSLFNKHYFIRRLKILTLSLALTSNFIYTFYSPPSMVVSFFIYYFILPYRIFVPITTALVLINCVVSLRYTQTQKLTRRGAVWRLFVIILARPTSTTLHPLFYAVLYFIQWGRILYTYICILYISMRAVQL